MTEVIVERLKVALSGRYAIERELGQGGMATVYLAQDVRHHRNVALKVLRPELAAVIGAERFLQEIRVTANLQHPHILPLHDSGQVYGPDQSGPYLFYVMPYVEGESLRGRLNRERQLPIEEAVRTATEVAAALDYAHRRGVIHRDIKPENILLASGAAVVADFGIARAVAQAGGGRLTETGLSLGTPQYMSPEQATADRELDGRSDVYALGCVLYEMLAGEPPHTGPTTQSVIAKILTENTRPIQNARPAVPAYLAAALHRALAKLPADRFRSALEFAEALTRPSLSQSGEPILRTTGVARTARPQAQLQLAMALALVFAGLALWGWLRPRPDRSAPVVRSVLNLPVEARVQGLGTVSPLALSPDGTVLVYKGPSQLYVRRLDQIDPAPLPNTLRGEQPFFSPDGQHVGFLADGSLKRVALGGGPAATLCTAPGLFGAAWGPRDLIVFSAGGKLFQVPATGGTAQPIVLADSAADGLFYRWPEFLPDGRHVLVAVGLLGYETKVVDLETGRVTPIEGAGSTPRFSEPGWLLSADVDGTVFAMPFDVRRTRVTGPAIPVLEQVSLGLAGGAKLAISRNGWAVYLPAVSSRRRLTLVDRRGTATMIATESHPFSDPRFSPSGRAVAVTVLRPGGGLAGDIWVLDVQRAALSRLTFAGTHQFPDWSADGSRVVFTTLVADLRGAGAAQARATGSSNGVFWTPAGGGAVERLFESPEGQIFEGSLTSNERMIVYRVGGIPGDVYFVRRDTAAVPQAFLRSAFDERSAAVSPNNRWLAYVSNETGRDEVYVRPFPEGGGRWLVSAAGGTEPRWGRNGRELFYRNADTLIAVQVRTQPDFAVDRRVALFTADYLTNPRHATYDVHPDGQRFIFVTGDPDDSGDLILVQNLLSALPRERTRDPTR